MNLEDILEGWNGCVCSGGGGSEDAYIIHFDYETGLLDKTWAEIKNALDTFGQARVVILPSDQEGNVYVVTSCADDGHGEYTITAYWGNSDNSYLTDSEDGYPTLD